MTRDEMKLKLIEWLIQALSKLITPELIKDAITAGVDTLEGAVKDTDNRIDDKLCLPIITAIREIIEVEG